MNDEVCQGLATKTDNPRFAWDSYRRFLEMFGNVVLEIPRAAFEDELDDLKMDKGILEDSELTVDDLQILVDRFKAVYTDNGHTFPTDVYEQLKLSISAVFRGWMGPRAIKYREVEDIRGLLGTAVNVQSMVFGNMGDSSGTGVVSTNHNMLEVTCSHEWCSADVGHYLSLLFIVVSQCFTRDPNNGANELFGELLFNAQGEDVVVSTIRLACENRSCLVLNSRAPFSVPVKLWIAGGNSHPSSYFRFENSHA
jgi:pyruvate, orthophosphate dikinase